MSDYKCVVFDLGGIVVPETGDHVLAVMSRYLGIDPSVLMHWFQRFFQDLTTGRMTLLDAYTIALGEMAIDKTPNDARNRHLEAYAGMASAWDQDVIRLIEELREKRPVVCITNTEPEIADFNRKAGLFDLFDRAFISTELGLAKPEPEIFHRTAELLGMKTRDIIFIDDRSENVAAAKSCGMGALQYDSIAEIKKDLRETKVLEGT
ncbi:MAG: HAD-IA family hydrolase [Candidatus Sumerlaeia bacterium]